MVQANVRAYNHVCSWLICCVIDREKTAQKTALCQTSSKTMTTTTTTTLFGLWLCVRDFRVQPDGREGDDCGCLARARAISTGICSSQCVCARARCD